MPHHAGADDSASLPTTLAELLDLHRSARARRNSAALGSSDWERAVEEIARIEVQIARVERSASPPLV